MTQLSLSVRQAADETGTSQKTIRDAINSGRLKAKRLSDKPGARLLVLRSDLVAWLDSLEDAAS